MVEGTQGKILNDATKDVSFPTKQWFHVEGKLNEAKFASRKLIAVPSIGSLSFSC